MPRAKKKDQLNAISRYALVRAKVERAKQNIRDIENTLASVQGDVLGAKRYVPPRRKKLVYRVPLDTLTAAGDVLNNLRGALDHLVTQMSLARDPRLTQREIRSCQFPIRDTEALYNNAKKKDLEFLRSETVHLIDTFRPYKAGNYELWLLNELNNISKHRLIPNVGNVVLCSADWVGEISMSTWFMYKSARPQFSGIWGRQKSSEYVLPTGKEVLKTIRPGRREALLPTLDRLVQVVEGLIKDFLPHL